MKIPPNNQSHHSTTVRFLCLLAFRNIFRYKRRTFITVGTIAFGVMIYLVLEGLMQGWYQTNLNNFINYESAHIKVMNEAYYTEWDDYKLVALEHTLDDYEALIPKDSDIAFAWAPRIVFQAQVYNEANGVEKYMRINAIDPEKESDLFYHAKKVLSGRFLEKNDEGLVLGNLGAEKLRVSVGDELNIICRDRLGAFQSFLLPVIGIVRDENPATSRETMFMPIALAQKEMAMGTRISELYFKLNKEKETEAFLSVLPTVEGVIYKTWRDLGKDWLTMYKADSGGNAIIIFFILIVATIGIVNTMLMSVFERTKEMGMMRALGLTQKQLVACFCLEGLVIGMIGVLLGMILGMLLNWPMVVYGIDWSNYVKDVKFAYRVYGVSHSVWTPNSMILIFVLTLIVSVLASLFPSYRATKREIKDCLEAH